MSENKVPFLKSLLISLLILVANILNFFDLKLRNIFIFVNILVIATFLMFYIRPILDSNVLFSNDTSSITKTDSETVFLPDTTPEVIILTEPVKSFVYVSSLPVKARSFLIYDLETKSEIYSKDKLLTLPPASLVKMLSVMYFFDSVEFTKKYETFSECNLVEGQKVGFKNKELVSGKDLIYSSLVFSGGDSVCNLYKISNLDIKGFNEYANKLGMNNSNFTNFIGLDFPGNYTNTNDMLTMSLRFIEKGIFNEIVKIKKYQMENGKVVFNTNKLLFEDPFSEGIKTGTTYGARENLIYRHKNPEKELDVLIILMNSSSRYQDIKNILNDLKEN